MKFDLDCTKRILEHIEQSCDGISDARLEVNEFSGEEIKKEAYHLRLLLQAQIVEGEIEDTSTLGERAEWILYRGLTLQGHQLLDSMRNDTVWNKIKDGAAKVGVEGLRQIPALALKLLMSG